MHVHRIHFMRAGWSQLKLFRISLVKRTSLYEYQWCEKVSS